MDWDWRDVVADAIGRWRTRRKLVRLDPDAASRPGTVEVWNELEAARQSADGTWLRDAVASARTQGLSWDHVAAALGISAEAARVTYGLKERPLKQWTAAEVLAHADELADRFEKPGDES